MSDLNELAARVEGLTRPDREVDLAVSVAINFKNGFTFGDPLAGKWRWSVMGDEIEFIRADNGKRFGVLDPAQFVPRWTASLDAAMGLVPEGWAYRLEGWTAFTARVFIPEQLYLMAHSKHSLALALTAACLRALATQQEPTNG